MRTKEFFSWVIVWEPVGKVREVDDNIRPLKPDLSTMKSGFEGKVRVTC